MTLRAQSSDTNSRMLESRATSVNPILRAQTSNDAMVAAPDSNSCSKERRNSFGFNAGNPGWYACILWVRWE
jgi:hypothetical protein